MKLKQRAVWLFLLSAFCFPLCLRADITAIVYPGHVFTDGEDITVESLNLLGRPTIYVFGTLGGTNVSLGAGTVTGTALSDTVVDDLTTVFNGSTPRAIAVKYDNTTLGVVSSHLAVKSGGISHLQMALQAISSDRLVTNLLVDVAQTAPGTNDLLLFGDLSDHTNNKACTFDQLAQCVATNPAIVTAIATTTNAFVSSLVSLSAASLLNVAHGWTNTPLFVRAVLVCQTPNQGYVQGDEVDVQACHGGGDSQSFTYGANSTNVFLNLADTSISMGNKTSGARVTITAGDWEARVYARP